MVAFHIMIDMDFKQAKFKLNHPLLLFVQGFKPILRRWGSFRG